MFEGFKSRTVSPSFKLTRTDAIPGTFCIATRTAWAHVSQSIPSVLSSTWRNSANADELLKQNNATSNARLVFMTTPLSEEKVTEVNRHADAFHGADAVLTTHSPLHTA